VCAISSLKSSRSLSHLLMSSCLCMLPIAVARSFSGGVTKSQREGAILRVFFPIQNALTCLCSIAFGTHTKTAEPIEMPFGTMTRVGPRYNVLDGGPDFPRVRGNFFGEKVLVKFARWRYQSYDSQRCFVEISWWLHPGAKSTVFDCVLLSVFRDLASAVHAID